MRASTQEEATRALGETLLALLSKPNSRVPMLSLDQGPAILIVVEVSALAADPRGPPAG